MKTPNVERTKITMPTGQDHAQRDWLAEAATAYDNGNIEEASAAAQIEIASILLGGMRAINENLDGIGNALGDLIQAVRGN